MVLGVVTNDYLSPDTIGISFSFLHAFSSGSLIFQEIYSVHVTSS